MAGKRRIDRVLDSELGGKAPQLDTAAVRALRDDCREEESRLSYLRRLLHARLDIAKAEVTRRGGDGQDLLARLPEILAEHGGGGGQPRALGVYTPDEQIPARRHEDRVLDDSDLSRLPELEEGALEDLLRRLAEVERDVSEQRSQVLDNLETLQGELVSRYQDGRANIDEVLSAPDS